MYDQCSEFGEMSRMFRVTVRRLACEWELLHRLGTIWHCIWKGEAAEGMISFPVIWFLGRSRICCVLSHQWSAITGYTNMRDINWAMNALAFARRCSWLFLYGMILQFAAGQAMGRSHVFRRCAGRDGRLYEKVKNK